MWKKGCDHDVVLLIFGTRFLAQTATEKHPNKHSVQNKQAVLSTRVQMNLDIAFQK